MINIRNEYKQRIDDLEKKIKDAYREINEEDEMEKEETRKLKDSYRKQIQEIEQLKTKNRELTNLFKENMNPIKPDSPIDYDNFLNNYDDFFDNYKDTSEPIGTKNIGAFAAFSVATYKAQIKNIDDRIKYLHEKVDEEFRSYNEKQDMIKNIQKLSDKKEELRKKIEDIKYGKDITKTNQRGKGYVNLPILLSKMYTNNSSKKLINDIEQLVKYLCNKKQITKQVYNNLIKTITYKNDS